MNTKSRNFKVDPAFEDLFSFSSKEEKIQHRAQMISYRILSEVEKICEGKNILMKDLAKMVNTSASYITQLFRGNKQVNTAFMARFEESMNMYFDFSLRKEVEEIEEQFNPELYTELIKLLHKQNPEVICYFAHKENKKDGAVKVRKLLESSANENSAKLSA